MTISHPLVVGIGASAGGIPALQEFFSQVPEQSGMAFVIVTHLSPERKSLLHKVVGQYAPIPVEVAEEGALVRGDRVYIMPEAKILTIDDGRLRLRADDPLQRERKPIDVFFASLARDQGENAAGIILSGGDSDGTLGVKAIKAIKERGGFTFAQVKDGSGPHNSEMPDSAIASGLIDFAEPAERMPARLAQIRAGSAQVGALVAPTGNAEQADTLDRIQGEISQLLRSHSGHDFSGYKSRTFIRRVVRRMKVQQLGNIEAYVQSLKDDPGEVMALFRDLLINVTNFFRDAEAFEALRAEVVPKLFEGRGADDTIRIWVPGCATGEEVYSLGMLMREHMDGLDRLPRVQIFATDIDEEALAIARAGRYPSQLLEGVSEARRRRFFRRDGASEVISKDVREMCVFSPHNVIGDPPFSRMDLVSCRNLLIYMGAEAQDRVIPTFHYALKPGGYLFLGTSEGVSRHGGLFAAIDKQRRIFQSRSHTGQSRRLPMVVDDPTQRFQIRRTERRSFDTGGIQLRQLVESQVLEHHAPAHVVITHDGEITFYSSNTGRYLEAPRGAPNRHLLEMARRELRLDLRAALRQAMETRRPAMRQVLMMEPERQDGYVVELQVELLEGPGQSEPMYLVLFKYLAEAQPLLEQIQTAAAPHDGQDAIERELRELRERLQSTIEEYETALEELKSSNEELVSVNEEAQSTNEELEASKEEMQSLNEELTTINGELATSVEELDRANTDLQNLYAATEIATIFLDRDLVIRNFTPAASAFFSLRDSDIGRPLTDLASRLHYPGLEERVREVFDRGEGIEHRIAAEENARHYLVRLIPYRADDDSVDGVVVTIVDITSLAEAEAQHKVLIAELNHRVRNMLTVAVGLANSTRKTSSSLDDFAEKLMGRLQGMGRAYCLLSETGWSRTSLTELLEAELAIFDQDRFGLSGPEVVLVPQRALAFGMIVHEAVTNATKYGALSNAAGRVEVAWEIRDDQVTWHWREIGGPPVAAPDQPGFGLSLIEGQLQSQLGGTSEVRFEPEGLSITLTFPLSGPETGEAGKAGPDLPNG